MRETFCVCGCGRHTFTPGFDGWTCTPQRDRGDRVAYTCPVCLSRTGHVGDGTPQGKECGGGIAYRLILPVTRESPALTAYLLKNKWAREDGRGYTSAQHKNLNSFKKLFPTLADMRAAGEWAGAQGDACALIVGPWDGFTTENLARIDAARGELFNGARVAVTREGIGLDVRFIDPAQVMDCLKQAKAMMTALLKWLNGEGRTSTVRKFFTPALPA